MDDPRLSSFSPIVKDLIIRLLKKNPKERLSSAEAKEHIWFVPPLTYLSYMKSNI